MTIKFPPAPMKIYSAKGDYLGCTVYAEDAAVLVSAQGVGATIRNGHAKKHIVWREGGEEQPAGESFDFVAEVVYSRIDGVPPGKD